MCLVLYGLSGITAVKQFEFVTSDHLQDQARFSSGQCCHADLAGELHAALLVCLLHFELACCLHDIAYTQDLPFLKTCSRG